MPFRDLPLWLKWWKVESRIRDKLETWRLEFVYAAGDVRKVLRRKS
ncbi:MULTISPECIES: hypothetical protein [unclassified Streptomyces]|nr:MULTISPECIES: hypothetical protein [unclassified Streptomyces]MCX5131480.1 hypothetical protein [Streptomyces sp. NBC_00340]NEB32382.1 hypothetical protein [Streptomyces sp. SID14446]